MIEIETSDYEVWPKLGQRPMLVRPSQNHPELKEGDIFRAARRFWGGAKNKPCTYRVNRVYLSLLQRVLPFEAINEWDKEWRPYTREDGDTGTNVLYSANPMVWVAELEEVRG
jgi:hypothetical protein